MLKLPYGLADFPTLVRDGFVYLDRTQHLATIEELGRLLLFVRPRRFGKSLWLRTLATYYDLRTAEEHDTLFGHLAVGRRPTPNAHRYFVLQWDFSAISPRGTVDDLARSLDEYINTTLGVFLRDYQNHLPAFALHDDAKNSFLDLLGVIRQTGHPLYLLIDEYDNFANELMVRDEGTYRSLVHGDGPMKELMKTVKTASQGQGLERLFVTGVSPVVMSDLSSGMNILTDIYQRPELNALCGFDDTEIVDLLERIRDETGDDGATQWNVDSLRAMVRDWYNGYRFSPMAEEKVYNPTMALYFLDHLQRDGEPPRELLDANLSADEDKLRFVGQMVAGQQTVLDRLQNDAPLEIAQLASRFRLSEMLDRDSVDATFLASFLYYFGMLTLGEQPDDFTLRLTTPNLVVRKLYVEQAKRFLLPSGLDRTAADTPARAVARGAELEPLLAFVEEKIFRVMSNRDYRYMDEHALKMVFLVLLFNDAAFFAASEPELDRGYADLCLLRRPDRELSTIHDLLFEFKYLGLAELGVRGETLRAMERKDLEELPAVRRRLDEAEDQLRRYEAALRDRHADLRLRAWAVVSLGFERLVARELPSPPSPTT